VAYSNFIRPKTKWNTWIGGLGSTLGISPNLSCFFPRLSSRIYHVKSEMFFFKFCVVKFSNDDDECMVCKVKLMVCGM
jgi:hypothetical protein